MWEIVLTPTQSTPASFSVSQLAYQTKIIALHCVQELINRNGKRENAIWPKLSSTKSTMLSGHQCTTELDSPLPNDDSASHLFGKLENLLHQTDWARHFLLTPTSFIDVWNDFLCLQQTKLSLLHHSAVLRLLPPLHTEIKHRGEIFQLYISLMQKCQFMQGFQKEIKSRGQQLAAVSQIWFGPTKHLQHDKSIFWFAQSMTTPGEAN